MPESRWEQREQRILEAVNEACEGGEDPSGAARSVVPDLSDDIYRETVASLIDGGYLVGQKQRDGSNHIAFLRIERLGPQGLEVVGRWPARHGTSPIAREQMESSQHRDANRDKLQSAHDYDVFISHASEDKDEVARPLYERLTKRGLAVWFDEQELHVGDGLRDKIDDGLRRSRYGVVILSPDFFRKGWPKEELDGLVTRQTSEGRKVILPVWHNVSKEDVAEYSPTLAGKMAATTRDGLDGVVDALIRAVQADITESPNR